MEGIRKVQARRKEEIVSSANRSNSGGSRAQEEKGEKCVFLFFLENSCCSFILCIIFYCRNLIMHYIFLVQVKENNIHAEVEGLCIIFRK